MRDSSIWNGGAPARSVIGYYRQNNPNWNTYPTGAMEQKFSTVAPKQPLTNRDWDNNILSVVVRFYEGENFDLLDQALFSLAGSDYEALDVIVVAENATAIIAAGIEHLLRSQPWSISTSTHLRIVEIGDQNCRSTLLNAGIGMATGKYLAFLDYDDTVYQRGYSVLIDKLKRSKATLAIGSTRRVEIQSAQQIHTVLFKDFPFSWARSKPDLVRGDFIPIHSFVIDRSRCTSEMLGFDPTMDSSEDHEFLLRMAANYEFNFDLIDVPVCEYRFHRDQSKSTRRGHPSIAPKTRQGWRVKGENIAALKSKLLVLKSVKGFEKNSLMRSLYRKIRSRGVHQMGVRIRRSPFLRAILHPFVHSIRGVVRRFHVTQSP
jgi:glycosyltransferase involved in cell wall biosynthesis